MSTQSTSNPLQSELASAPHLFDFFQAVRLLHRWSREDDANGAVAGQPVGEDFPPADEVVRFRALPTLRFPAGEIHQFQQQPDAPPEMTVTFLGLIGAAGVLPRHYTQLMIERVRHRDTSLRDFLDLFHHRAISLFYRAWEKYRFPIGIERRGASSPGQSFDPFTHCLLCLVGLGTEHLRDRQQVPDEVLLFYGGHFAHQPKNAIGLEQVLSDYFGLPVELHQFEGRWLHLAAKDQTRLPAGNVLGRRYQRLGDEALVGERVWSVEHRFRVRVGPLNYSTFRRLTPAGDLLRPMCQLIRTYAGPDFDFDVQLVLRSSETPACRIAAAGENAARLGWDAWSRNREFVMAVDDAVFEDDGGPNVVTDAP